MIVSYKQRPGYQHSLTPLTPDLPCTTPNVQKQKTELDYEKQPARTKDILTDTVVPLPPS